MTEPTEAEAAARAALEERARRLFAGPIMFLKSAPAPKFLPDPSVPEIAFSGRPHVGKSPLLHAPTGPHLLARTSATASYKPIAPPHYRNL